MGCHFLLRGSQPMDGTHVSCVSSIAGEILYPLSHRGSLGHWHTAWQNVGIRPVLLVKDKRHDVSRGCPRSWLRHVLTGILGQFCTSLKPQFTPGDDNPCRNIWLWIKFTGSTWHVLDAQCTVAVTMLCGRLWNPGSQHTCHADKSQARGTGVHSHRVNY